MTELAQPLMVRRAVCFGEAVYAGEARVEEITARLAPDAETALALAAVGVIPVLIDPDGRSRAGLAPALSSLTASWRSATPACGSATRRW